MADASSEGFWKSDVPMCTPKAAHRGWADRGGGRERPGAREAANTTHRGEKAPWASGTERQLWRGQRCPGQPAGGGSGTAREAEGSLSQGRAFSRQGQPGASFPQGGARAFARIWELKQHVVHALSLPGSHRRHVFPVRPGTQGVSICTQQAPWSSGNPRAENSKEVKREEAKAVVC